MHNNFYINRNDKVRGPFSEERVRELYAEGKLRDTDFLSTRSDGGWEPVRVVLNRRPANRVTAKGKSSSTSSVNNARRSMWIVMGVTAAAVMGVGIWKFGFSQPDVAEVATNSSVPSEIAPQSSQANAHQGGRETERSITVEFEGLDGASIGWVADGKLERRQVAVPGKKEFQFNTRRQLYIDNVRLAGMEGVAFYPTLHLRSPPDMLSPSTEAATIKLELNELDFRAANEGDLVTKVWYTKHETPTVIESLSNLTVPVRGDLESLASQRGKVIAVFHMGNRVRNLEVASPDAGKSNQTSAEKTTSVDSPVDTIQVKFVGLDGMSIGWFADGQDFPRQGAVPFRAELAAGEKRKLILENIPVDGWRDVVLMPTLEVMAATPVTAAFLEHCAIRVDIFERDLHNMKDNSTAVRNLSLSNPELATKNDRGFIPALTVMARETQSGADINEPHDAAAMAILRLNGSIAWRAEPPAKLIRPNLPVEKVLASKALAEFTSAISNESHKSNFTAAIRKLVESKWNNINSATPSLVIGQIVLPDEKLLPQLNGLVMPLKGGYFAAIVGQSGQGELPFYAPGCRPVFVHVDGVSEDGVLDLGSHQMNLINDKDRISVRLKVVDERGQPIPAGQVNAVATLGLTGHEGYFYETQAFGLPAVAVLHSWNDRTFFARDSTVQGTNKSLKVGDDGVIEFQTEPGPLTVNFFSPHKQPGSLAAALFVNSSGKPVDLGQVILHDQQSFALRELHSTDDTFYAAQEVSEVIVPGDHQSLKPSESLHHSGLRRYLLLSQFKKQVYVRQFLGSINGIADLGEGTITDFRKTDMSKVKLLSLSEFNRMHWVAADDELASGESDSANRLLTNRVIRPFPGPARSECVQIKPGRVYVVSIGQRIGKTASPVAIMFSVASASDTATWLQDMLSKPIEADKIDYPNEVSLEEALNSMARNVSANHGDGKQMTIESDAESFRHAGLTSLADLKLRQLTLPSMSLEKALSATLSRIPNRKLKHIIRNDKIVIVVE